MILFIVTIENFYIGLPNSGFTPLKQPFCRFLNTSTVAVVMTSFSFLFGIVANSVLFNYLCQKFSLRYLNFLSLLVMLIGSVLRLFFETSLFFIYLGQFITGLGACIIINIQISVSFYWFSERTRGISLAIISIANLLGNVLVE
jgi:MFS family permease